MELLRSSNDEEESLVKVLLQHLSSRSGLSSLDLYRKCLNSSLDLRTSLHAISLMDDHNVMSFYRAQDKSKDPQFLSLDDPMTLRNISDVTGVRLVIAATMRSNPPMLIFDSGDDDWMKEAEDRNEDQTTMTYLLMAENKGRDQSVTFSHKLSPYKEDDLRHCMVGSQVNSGCNLTSLISMVDPENVSKVQSHAGDKPWDHRAVVLDGENLIKSITKKPLMIVLCRNKKMRSWRRHLQGEKKITKMQLFNPKSYEITCLMEVNADSNSLEDKIVVMPRIEGGWYRLNQSWSAECIWRFRTKKRITRPAKPVRDPVVPDELQLVKKSGKRKATKPDQSGEPAANETTSDQPAEPEPTCCDCCKGSKLYEDNMSKKGPQMLYRKPLDTVTLIKILGFYTKEMEEALQQCHKLSMASMDIESTTDSLKPNGETMAEQHNRPSDITDQPVRDDDLKKCKVQRPLCIGHSGNNGSIPVEGDLSSVKVFFRNKRSVQSMVDDYSEYLAQQREMLEVKKRSLLQPMLNRLAAYKKTYLEHFARSEDSNYELKGIQITWNRTLMGSLEFNLEQLCKKLYVFSFNGSR